MKRTTNADLIRKLDYSSGNYQQAYISNMKTVEDQGFRNFLGNLINEDEKRRQDFLKKKAIKASV